ncbi:hypothetical protein ACTQWG_16190 [Blautia sp. HCP3S3_H10_1]
MQIAGMIFQTRSSLQ